MLWVLVSKSLVAVLVRHFLPHARQFLRLHLVRVAHHVHRVVGKAVLPSLHSLPAFQAGLVTFVSKEAIDMSSFQRTYALL